MRCPPLDVHEEFMRWQRTAELTRSGMTSGPGTFAVTDTLAGLRPGELAPDSGIWTLVPELCTQTPVSALRQTSATAAGLSSL